MHAYCFLMPCYIQHSHASRGHRGIASPVAIRRGEGAQRKRCRDPRRYRAWAQSWSSAALAARSVLPSNRPATPLFSPACWEPGFQAWAHMRQEVM